MSDYLQQLYIAAYASAMTKLAGAGQASADMFNPEFKGGSPEDHQKMMTEAARRTAPIIAAIKARYAHLPTGPAPMPQLLSSGYQVRVGTWDPVSSSGVKKFTPASTTPLGLIDKPTLLGRSPAVDPAELGRMAGRTLFDGAPRYQPGGRYLPRSIRRYDPTRGPYQFVNKSGR